MSSTNQARGLEGIDWSHDLYQEESAKENTPRTAIDGPQRTPASSRSSSTGNQGSDIIEYPLRTQNGQRKRQAPMEQEEDISEADLICYEAMPSDRTLAATTANHAGTGHERVNRVHGLVHDFQLR